MLCAFRSMAFLQSVKKRPFHTIRVVRSHTNMTQNKKDRYRNSRIRFWNTAVFYIYPYFFRFPKINANVTITEIISAVTIENHIPFRPKKIGRTSTAMT